MTLQITGIMCHSCIKLHIHVANRTGQRVLADSFAETGAKAFTLKQIAWTLGNGPYRTPR